MKKLLFVALTIFTVARPPGTAAAEGPCIIPGRGRFLIHVGTAGLFGTFAHNHLVQAEKISGCATIDSNNPAHSAIKLEFPAAGLRVIDPKASEKDRAEIQKNMETQVLRVSEFSVVTFESTAIEPAQERERFRVHGILIIHGVSQSVLIPVTLTHLPDGTYRATGQYKFSQTSFGIKPIQLAAGTVKVKDELQVEFELFLK